MMNWKQQENRSNRRVKVKLKGGRHQSATAVSVTTNRVGILRSAVTQQRCFLYYYAWNLCCCNKDVFCKKKKKNGRLCDVTAIIACIYCICVPSEATLRFGCWQHLFPFVESVATCFSISQIYSKLHISLLSALFLQSCDGNRSGHRSAQTLRSFWFC